LNQGAQVVVKDSSVGWLHVDVVDDGSGWISSNALLPASGTAEPSYARAIESGAAPKMVVDRTAVGAMIKGLTARLEVSGEVASAYEPVPGINENSVKTFRGEFETVDVSPPVSAVEAGRGLMPKYLSISPVLAVQQVAAWGGRNEALEPYCNQVLLWLADRAGAAHLPVRAYVAMLGGNEFCLPGGWIVIGGDIIRQVRDESELAGIIGHELAHAYFRHGEEGLEKESWRLGVADAFAELEAETGGIDEDLDDLEQFAASVRQMVGRKYDLDMELTADSAATVWLARSGYDPEGLLRFLKRVREGFGDRLTGHAGGISLAWLNSREELDSRIGKLVKQVKKLKKRYKDGKRFEERFRERVNY